MLHRHVMTGSTPASERRRELRHRAFLGGIVLHGPKFFTLDCAVRDHTATGARLRIPGNPPLLSPAYLLIIALETAYEVTPVWRGGDELGVDFLSPVNLADAEDPIARVLHRFL